MKGILKMQNTFEMIFESDLSIRILSSLCADLYRAEYQTLWEQVYWAVLSETSCLNSENLEQETKEELLLSPFFCCIWSHPAILS